MDHIYIVHTGINAPNAMEPEINDSSKVLSIELPTKLYIYLLIQVYFKFIFLTILGIYIFKPVWD